MESKENNPKLLLDKKISNISESYLYFTLKRAFTAEISDIFFIN